MLIQEVLHLDIEAIVQLQGLVALEVVPIQEAQILIEVILLQEEQLV